MRKLFSYRNCDIFVTKPQLYYYFTAPIEQNFACFAWKVDNKTISEIVQQFYREWVLLLNLKCAVQKKLGKA